jgi:transposase
MEPSRDILPEDAPTLREIVGELIASNKALQAENQRLKDELASILQRLFGRRSEKLNPDQLKLIFDEAEAATAILADPILSHVLDAPDEVAAAPPASSGRRTHPGRDPLPEHLPRQRIEIRPEDTRCPCCQGEMRPMGEEITEELGRIPARFFVRQYVRIKYTCPECPSQIVRPPLPARLLDRSRAGFDVTADVVVAKYGDHLPLHRQAAIYAREGVDIDKSTLCEWVGRAAELLQPVVQDMRRQLLLAPIVQSDDTPIQYLVPGAEPGIKRGYLWTYVSDQDDVLYEFTTSRKRAGPCRFLEGFQGYLQADGYSGYNEILSWPGVIAVACWAHARRKFLEAKKSEPQISATMLVKIRQLYAIEARAKDQSLAAAEVAALRQRDAVPLLADLEKYLRALALDALPESAIGKATAYALKRWPALCRYCDDGRLAIDNNSAERAMRLVAVGRKNYLFAGAVSGGHRAAVFYSLIETCKRHGINPHEYLTDVLERVSTHPQRQIADLTPRGWLAAKTTTTLA